MDKRATWAATGAVAATITAAGVAVDRRLGTAPAASLAAGTLAAGYLTSTFAPLVPLFGRAVATRTDEGLLALTFDDGPDPRHTAAISELLAERGHRATFFVLARAVRARPALAAVLLAHGHEIASHGDDHRLLAFAAPSEIRRQLVAAELAVQQATGRLPAPLFRPPHGVRSPWLASVLGQLGYRLCAWHGSVFDTAEPGADVIAERVTRLLRPGSVVLLHDGDGTGHGRSRQQTVEALPAILEQVERRGLRSERLSELIT
jgi:peptidoglycan/xylan/chitin deacetylase (PgdA/CDA1 family)